MTKEQTESNRTREEARIDTVSLQVPTEPKRKVTTLNILTYSTFSAAIALVLYIFYLLLYPFTPLVIKSITIDTPVVKVNGSLIYTINACKNTRDTPTVYRKIVSGKTSESLPASPGVVSPGCETTKVPIHITPGTPTGTYVLYTEVVYHVSPFRDIHVFWHTKQFQITN
jgi:hypothetical protein